MAAKKTARKKRKYTRRQLDFHGVEIPADLRHQFILLMGRLFLAGKQAGIDELAARLNIELKGKTDG